MGMFSLEALECGQTEVSTLICDSKQLRKLDAIRSKLTSLQNVIYFEDDEKEDSFSGSSSGWTIASFSEVEKLGKESPVEPSLPSKNDTAVIMYTSGSTGLPKVCFFFNYCRRCSPFLCLIFMILSVLAKCFVQTPESWVLNVSTT